MIGEGCFDVRVLSGFAEFSSLASWGIFVGFVEISSPGTSNFNSVDVGRALFLAWPFKILPSESVSKVSSSLFLVHSSKSFPFL